MAKLIDGAINGMLETLDPHSVYIPAEEQKRIAEQFQGEFEGIGISFVIQNKILTVISPIPGTPADRLGIRAGDQIIKINRESTYGITNEEVFKKLRGPKGTTVDVTINREGLTEPLEFTIIRDKIPIHSVETAFMLDKKTGYILLNQFTSNTSQELEASLRELEAQGMSQLLFDLRGNSGGFLMQAIGVADKFLPAGEKIVFTRGRTPSSEKAFFATKNDKHTGLTLIVMLSNGSASASEIVAGAIQDLDRGLVVGERSFGKGLVQTQIPFDDGSVVRLTTARYYTPSGRLIQRPYSKNISDYYLDAFQADTIDTNKIAIDSVKDIFYTQAGRKVYGGGGIEPDTKIPATYLTPFTSKLFNQRLFFEYSTRYAAAHPEWNKDYEIFLQNFTVSEAMLTDFMELAKSKKIEIKEEDVLKDKDLIETLLKAEMAQNLYNGRLYYYRVRISQDPQVKEAMKLFDKAKEIVALKSKKN
jgi:carboxyl-terminal processing protease